MREFRKYAHRVAHHVPAGHAVRKKIRQDIQEQLDSMNLREGYDDPVDVLGTPEELAEKLIHDLGIEKSIYHRTEYEYRSELELFGLPLVHITGGNKVAKGIIAIGGVSLGVFSLGGLSFGLISIGGVSAGLLFALGGTSLSGGFALGGLALGYYGALGGLAISKVLAVGGLALAKDIAIGDVAQATVCGFQSSFEGLVGVHMPTESHKLPGLVRDYFPHLNPIYHRLIEAISNQ